MRQKEVLQKLSEEIRKLHKIEIKKHRFHYYGTMVGQYIGFPTSLIKEIKEEKVTFHIELREGILTLWKDYASCHLSLFDRKARNRQLARKRREEVKKVGPMPRKLSEQSDTSMPNLSRTG